MHIKAIMYDMEASDPLSEDELGTVHMELSSYGDDEYTFSFAPKDENIKYEMNIKGDDKKILKQWCQCVIHVLENVIRVVGVSKR